MQILRFEDAPEVAPKRKKSSAGWVGIGLVAALFGVSTAFASSTISINETNTINLAQGVVAVKGCESDIGILPSTTLVKKGAKKLDFDVTGLTIGFDYNSTGAGKISGSCGNNDADETKQIDPVDFKLQFYVDGETPVAKTCDEMFDEDDISSAEAFAKGLKVSVPPGTFLPSPDIKCEGSSLWFKMIPVPTLVDTTTFEISLPAGFKASLFDYITLETSETTY